LDTVHIRSFLRARRAWLGAFVVALVVFVSMTTAAVGMAAEQPDARPAASGCKPYVFLGARGSGEPAPTTRPLRPDTGVYGVRGLGRPLSAEYARLREILGASYEHLLEARYVAYDAVQIPPSKLEAFGLALDPRRVGVVAGTQFGRYSRSVDQGKQRMRDEIENIVERCPPATRLILGGYSQGAHVAGDVFASLPKRLRDRVLAVTLFGDPRFNPLSSGYGDFDPKRHGLLGAREPYRSGRQVRSWCATNDVVCQGLAPHWPIGGGVYDLFTEFSFKPHLTYPTLYSPLGAVWLIQQMRRNEAAKGSVPPAEPPPAGRPVDVAFAVDTTGSMDSAIDSVRDNLSVIRDRLAASATDLRTALAEFKDEPAEDSAYQSLLVTGLTADADAFAGAISGLYAEGGGDVPESVYAGLMSALSVEWRAEAAKFVVLVGDAPPKDPEPITGFDAAAVVTASLRASAPIFGLVVGSDEETATAFAGLSSQTSGQSYDVQDPDAVANAILAAVDYRAKAPLAVVTGGPSAGRALASQSGPAPTAAVGEPVRLSSAGSASPLGETLTFTWDFGDGTRVVTTDTVVTHAWTSDYGGDVKLTVEDGSGRSAQALFPIRIAGRASSRPGKPRKLRSRLRGHRAVLSWSSSRRGLPTHYEVLVNGRVRAVVAAATDRRRSRVTLRMLRGGKSLRFRVRAWDVLGRSATSRTSRKITPAKKRRR
jgi:hypothetical protein